MREVLELIFEVLEPLFGLVCWLAGWLIAGWLAASWLLADWLLASGLLAGAGWLARILAIRPGGGNEPIPGATLQHV